MLRFCAEFLAPQNNRTKNNVTNPHQKFAIRQIPSRALQHNHLLDPHSGLDARNRQYMFQISAHKSLKYCRLLTLWVTRFVLPESGTPKHIGSPETQTSEWRVRTFMMINITIFYNRGCFAIRLLSNQRMFVIIQIVEHCQRELFVCNAIIFC